jgi:hypothetical protein
LPNVIPFPRVATPRVREVVALATALRRLPELAGSDIAMECADEIAVAHNGHVFGVWRVSAARYLYIPTGSREPTFRTSDVSRVLEYARLNGSLFVGEARTSSSSR